MWKKFSEVNRILLYVCVASAVRRGIINSKNDLENSNNGNIVFSVFRICGLTEIMGHLSFCDRFVKF